jgi:branched-subunit amino acid aminotransferase/4-amino-4-deoxychorismate lyase
MSWSAHESEHPGSEGCSILAAYAAAVPEPRLLAVDSWLVRDGRVRALDRHRQRFRLACRDALGEEPHDLDAFWAAMERDLPRTGTWWPRAELDETGQLSWQNRPVPPSPPQLSVSHAADPRHHPRRKGADLDTLRDLRQRQGTDEVILTTADGTVLEGTTTSLLWWDGDTLCRPGPDLPVLTGITAELIVEEAAAQGIQIAARSVMVGELDGHEVWLVNAVHGIRLPLGVRDCRGATWHRWLDRQAGPLS